MNNNQVQTVVVTETEMGWEVTVDGQTWRHATAEMATKWVQETCGAVAVEMNSKAAQGWAAAQQ